MPPWSSSWLMAPRSRGEAHPAGEVGAHLDDAQK